MILDLWVFFFFNFVSLGVLFACLSVHHIHAESQKPEGVGSPGSYRLF